MPIAIVHLSDIHFGQEVGGDVFIHDDAKLRLIEDVQAFARFLPDGRASGIIVTGDIAYAGKKEEYDAAGPWLDKVASAAGCAITDIQVVPGNHDIDRDAITKGAALMLKEVVECGEKSLDEFLKTEADKKLLYGRFSAYELFALGYQSPLDKNGGRAGERIVDLAPDRKLRFIGLNTALACAAKDVEGTLLLGSRQRALPKTDGEELIVIAHHPIKWVRDSEDAGKFLRARARVFISGHEHLPSIQLEKGADGADLLLVAAGATVPPKVDEHYLYTYNIIVFDLDAATSNLSVTIHTRQWSDDKKAFACKNQEDNKDASCSILYCPNFQALSMPRLPASEEAKADASNPTPTLRLEDEVQEERKAPNVPPKSSLLRLRFFRDLNATQRLSILVKLNALPPDWDESLTHSMEGRILDALHKQNRLEELEKVINETLTIHK